MTRPVLTAMLSGACLVAACVGLAGAQVHGPQQPAQQQQQQPQLPPAPLPRLDVPFVPTPDAVGDEMLKLAGVRKGDVVYDLGCGDGRLVISAAKKYGARGVGIDIDPRRIKESNENAKLAGVADRVKFVEQDLFEADVREASVVTLYLLPDVNLRLRPKLLRDLKPGSRVVSQSFDMGDWVPDKTVYVDGRPVHLWTIPARKDADGGAANAPARKP